MAEELRHRAWRLLLQSRCTAVMGGWQRTKERRVKEFFTLPLSRSNLASLLSLSPVSAYGNFFTIPLAKLQVVQGFATFSISIHQKEDESYLRRGFNNGISLQINWRENKIELFGHGIFFLILECILKGIRRWVLPTVITLCFQLCFGPAHLKSVWAY